MSFLLPVLRTALFTPSSQVVGRRITPSSEVTAETLGRGIDQDTISHHETARSQSAFIYLALKFGWEEGKDHEALH